MNLQDKLDQLADHIGSFKDTPKISDDEWLKFAENTTVALMAGGESSRFAAVLPGEKMQKNAHELPNGDTMIEMAIRQYRDAGIKKFVALVYHSAFAVEQRLGDGSSLGVSITYSQDPEPPAGKGGAIRHAIEQGFITESDNLIVCNPDDVIINFPGSYVRDFGEAHIDGTRQGMLATAVLAKGQPYAATGMMVQDNKVIDTTMYPLIPVPAHVGITFFAPEILPRFRELFDLTKKNDFENILFPLLAQEGKLWSVPLTEGTWIAVNDLKSYNQLIQLLPNKETT
ncbi:MAG: sugar phosphate nucleotidyltransferase [Patescibacteria group bacterium]|nr:sugar phosphate nucleotidyltransferase [Patescibacteria group bacterium]